MLVRRTNEVATRRRGSRGAHADDLARVGPAQGLHNPHCHSTAVLQAARRHQRYRRVDGRRLDRTAWPTGLVSSRRHLEPCVRFSRTRLTDVLHRRHSVSPSPRPMWARRDDDSVEVDQAEAVR